MTNGTTSATCGHTYSKGGSRFVCDAAPHPRRPDRHYFVKAAPDGTPAPPHHRGLVIVPGERRG